MKILIYGDSNTWGYIPNVNGYSKNSIAQQYNPNLCWWYFLCMENDVFVNGLCGRSIDSENKWFKGRNATKTIETDLKSFDDCDLVCVQLGTNDCKDCYNLSPEEITSQLLNLCFIIKSKLSKSKVLIISPSVINENTIITHKYYKGAKKKCVLLDECYKNMADANGFLFASGLTAEVGEDGEHLTIYGHNKLAESVQSTILNFYNYENNL